MMSDSSFRRDVLEFFAAIMDMQAKLPGLGTGQLNQEDSKLMGSGSMMGLGKITQRLRKSMPDCNGDNN